MALPSGPGNLVQYWSREYFACSLDYTHSHHNEKTGTLVKKEPKAHGLSNTRPSIEVFVLPVLLIEEKHSMDRATGHCLMCIETRRRDYQHNTHLKLHRMASRLLLLLLFKTTLP